MTRNASLEQSRTFNIFWNTGILILLLHQTDFVLRFLFFTFFTRSWQSVSLVSILFAHRTRIKEGLEGDLSEKKREISRWKRSLFLGVVFVKRAKNDS